MLFSELCTAMEKIAPCARALEWDHVGLMIGDPAMPIRGILTCLDVTPAVLEEAVRKECNVVLSHHPFLFDPLPAVDYGTFTGGMTAYAIRHGIAIFSAHTNLDYAEEGVNRALAERLQLHDIRWDADKTHLIGVFDRADLTVFLLHTQEALQTKIRVIGPEKLLNRGGMLRVGVSSGAFDGETDWCRAEKIDVLVTGEIKHSAAILLCAEAFTTVCAGHFATEHPVTGKLAKILCAQGFPAQASQTETDPFTVC